MADPVNLIRQYYLNKKKIVEQDDEIIFGDLSWPRNTKTNYLVCGSGNNGSSKEYYTLECILFLLKNEHLKHSVYVRQAASDNIPIVRRPDRKHLLAYMRGESRTSIAKDNSALFKVPIPLKRDAQDCLENSFAKKPRYEETYVQKVKQQLAARLDAPKEVTVSIDNIKSLSEVMTVDKIAAIKAKRLVKKRTTIKEYDNTEMDSDVRVILDLDVDDTKDIINRERQYRTRKNILQSNRKGGFADVLKVLDDIQIREDNKQKGPMLPPVTTVVPRSIPPRPTLQQTTYNRYDQEKFVEKTKETGEFKINTTGTYHGIPLESVKEGTNPAYRQPLPVVSGNLTATPKSGTLPTSSAKFTPQKAAQNKRSSRTPIIIVPPSVNTSLITMHNATDILQDLRYISNEEKRSQGAKRENEVLLQRRKQHGTVPYRVVNNPQKLTKEEWGRVVAVFVLGPQWQFKGWPTQFNGNPVEIFSKIAAFHIKYDEMPLDANIARWSVSIIELSKTKRHLDRAAIMKFWEVLDKYLTQKKPHLRF